MAEKAEKDSGRPVDLSDKIKDQVKAVQDILYTGGPIVDAESLERIAEAKANPPQEARPNGDGSVQRLVSERAEALLNEVGKLLGEEGFIFVGGLIPYVKVDNAHGWDLDINKEPIRISNINEAHSARVSMGLFAYLIESLQGDLERELGLEAQTKGQTPA